MYLGTQGIRSAASKQRGVVAGSGVEGQSEPVGRQEAQPLTTVTELMDLQPGIQDSGITSTSYLGILKRS